MKHICTYVCVCIFILFINLIFFIQIVSGEPPSIIVYSSENVFKQLHNIQLHAALFNCFLVLKDKQAY